MTHEIPTPTKLVLAGKRDGWLDPLAVHRDGG